MVPHELHHITLVKYHDDGDEMITNISRVQRDVDPDESDSDDEDVRDAAEVNFLYEVSAVDAVHEIGHGPKLLDYASQPQGPQLPWQEGWVDFILMSRVPGENLMDVYQDLDDDQLRSVRFQIADILE